MKQKELAIIVAFALVAGITTTTIVPQAFADHKPGHENADDKNNPTFPGTGQGNNPPDQANNEKAGDNTDEHCATHDKGSPAQCYFGDGK
jgi:hypothetical protein